MLSFSRPANSLLELTGLLLGNAGEKGRCLGAWEPSPHASPSPGLSRWDISSTKGTLPKISRHCSVKMRGTELVSGNASPAWQPAELEHLNAAAFAQCSRRSDGDAPAHSSVCLGHTCAPAVAPPAPRWDVGSAPQPPAGAGALY